MKIPFDDEPDRRITPAVWKAFAAWYREENPLDRSVHYEASHVEEVERLVREQVATEIDERGYELRSSDEGISREEWACYGEAAEIARKGIAGVRE
ncbi:hypothetical protein [Streptomyces sp. SM8]|uniref:hypothetical protein n=1 Tax=Streptomyces sp. SM8 TaxID=1195457 RepID=UPI000283112A|nr:hypothetical protein [Streptomyces sp. SM8]PKA37932.1 hypothetical protein SM8_029370 [Streptomyces sp. SM8]